MSARMTAARIAGMANGRVSVTPSSVSSASSIVPTWLKSCGRHSLIRDRFSTAIRRNGRRSASTPYGIDERARRARPARTSSRRARLTRRAPTGASVTASSANGPISMRPNTKPPCMFAHRVMSAARLSGGGRRDRGRRKAPRSRRPKRKRQHMRPRQQVRRHQRKADRHGRDERRAAQFRARR